MVRIELKFAPYLIAYLQRKRLDTVVCNDKKLGKKMFKPDAMVFIMTQEEPNGDDHNHPGL
jgi:hypothetical protein